MKESLSTVLQINLQSTAVWTTGNIFRQAVFIYGLVPHICKHFTAGGQKDHDCDGTHLPGVLFLSACQKLHQVIQSKDQVRFLLPADLLFRLQPACIHLIDKKLKCGRQRAIILR